MSYIGNSPYQVAFVTDTFNGNGSTTAFTMSVAPANTASVLVVVSGVVQDPSTYSVSGTTLTFTAAPPSGTGNISCRYLGIPASGVTTTAYRTVTEFTATAGQTTFTPPSYTAGFINVYRNGALLGTADYTATNGTTVVLAKGANSGDLVTVESFLVSSVLNAIPATAGSVGSTYIAAGAVGSSQIAAGAISNANIASNAGISTSKLGTGAVLQVVNATLTSPVTTTSTSMTSTGLTASITPSSSSNKILVYSSGIVSSSDGNQTLVQIVRNQPSANTRIDNQALNSGNSVYSIGIGDGYLSNRTRQTFAFKTLDAPATTNAITYTLNFMTGGSTAYLGRWGLDTNWNTPTCLVLMEIAA